MSNAIVTLFVIGLMLVAVFTWSNVSVNSLDSVSQNWKDMVDAATEVSRTGIEITGTGILGVFDEASIRNSGETNLAQFANWDVIVRYYDSGGNYHIISLAHTDGGNPGSGQWTVSQIYTDETLVQEEVFDPGILNPGEVMIIRMRLDPRPGSGTVNLLAVSSDSGVTASSQFQG